MRIPLEHLLKKSAPIDMAGSVRSDEKKPPGAAWGGAAAAEGTSPPASGMHPSLRIIQVRAVPYACAPGSLHMTWEVSKALSPGLALALVWICFRSLRQCCAACTAWLRDGLVSF